MVDFAKLKQGRQERTQKLVESLQKTNQYDSDDSRFWKPTMDEEKGVGGAVIRFLPTKDDSTLDYVTYSEYAFQWPETNKWFIEKSLYSIGKEDPVYHLRGRLYATKQESDKKLAEKMRLNKRFIANILVVNDPAHPELNGKVMLYRYGPTIQTLIETGLKPVADPITGQTPEVIDAFDMWEGANLEIRVKIDKNGKKKGWSYDDTKWSSPSAVGKTDADREALYNQTYSLAEFIAPSEFKSYEALEKRLVTVIGSSFIGTGVAVSVNGVEPTVQQTEDKPVQEESQPVQSKPAPAQREAVAETPQAAPWEDDTPAGEKSADDMFEDLMANM